MNQLRSLDHQMVALYEHLESLVPADGATPSSRDDLTALALDTFRQITGFMDQLAHTVDQITEGHGDRLRLEIALRAVEAQRRLADGLGSAMWFVGRQEFPTPATLAQELALSVGRAGWLVREAHQLLHHGRVTTPGHGWPGSDPEPILDEPNANTR